MTTTLPCLSTSLRLSAMPLDWIGPMALLSARPARRSLPAFGCSPTRLRSSKQRTLLGVTLTLLLLPASTTGPGEMPTFTDWGHMARTGTYCYYSAVVCKYPPIFGLLTATAAGTPAPYGWSPAFMEGSMLCTSAGVHPGTGTWPPETPGTVAALLQLMVSASWDHFLATSLWITTRILIMQSLLQMQRSEPEPIYSGIKQIKRCEVAVNGK